MVTVLSVADQMSMGTVSSVADLARGRMERGKVSFDIRMYSCAFRPLRATVRTMPQIPALRWDPLLAYFLKTCRMGWDLQDAET